MSAAPTALSVHQRTYSATCSKQLDHPVESGPAEVQFPRQIRYSLTAQTFWIALQELADCLFAPARL